MERFLADFLMLQLYNVFALSLIQIVFILDKIQTPRTWEWSPKNFAGILGIFYATACSCSFIQHLRIAICKKILKLFETQLKIGQATY